MRAVAAVSWLVLIATLARAQTGSESSVGYIDNAIPTSQVRLRYDAVSDNNRPTRAEFFYARGAPFGPGLPLPEPQVDYQDVSAYLEAAATERLSGFLEVPVRFLDPEVNANTAGLSDLQAGFKYAFLHDPAGVATFQLRTFAPTGDAGRGLGTRHVSLEPALLSFTPLGDRLALAGEFRTWVPVGGTDFAGPVLRYGVGLQYDLVRGCTFGLTPVAELVGWTVLSGQESAVFPSGISVVEDAAGDTIVNAKLGLRWKWGDAADLYTGYGRPLTGEHWYENIARIELRLFY